MVFFAFFEFLLAMCAGLLFVPAPIGLPPLPEDPLLLQAAPADAVIYVQWSGRGTPDPDHANPAVRIGSHPEMVAFIERLRSAIATVTAHEVDDEVFAQSERFVNYAIGLLHHPGCAFVGRLSPEEIRRGPADTTVGVVVKVGDDAAAANQAMADLRAMFEAEERPENRREGTLEIDGVTFEVMPGSRNDPQLALGLVDGYLVFAVGDASAEAIVANLRKRSGFGASERWTGVAQSVSVATPTTRVFVDFGFFRDLAVGSDRDAQEVLERLGLEGVGALVSETGLEGNRFVSRTHLETGERKGLLGFVDGAPLGAADLATIPGDADMALTTRLSPMAILERVIGVVPEEEREAMERQVFEGFKLATGVDLKDGLLAHMGDRVSLWSSPSQGGVLGSGLTLSWQLTDPDSFDQSFEKVMDFVVRTTNQLGGRQERGGRRYGTWIEERSIGEVPMWFINTTDNDVPFAPAWCVADGHLIASLYPQMLRDVVERGVRNSKSLADPNVLVAAEGARAVGYLNWPQFFPELYGALHPLGQIAAAELQREGFEITMADLPRTRVFLPNLEPTVARVVAEPDALHMERSGTMPLVDPGIVGGMLTFMLAMFSAF